ncbi:hypothetical protein M0804_004142 [Polistes exclamans]|nr:hypothetical protein M0804_004142 [Polistes exclamans]
MECPLKGQTGIGQYVHRRMTKKRIEKRGQRVCEGTAVAAAATEGLPADDIRVGNQTTNQNTTSVNFSERVGMFVPHDTCSLFFNLYETSATPTEVPKG